MVYIKLLGICMKLSALLCVALLSIGAIATETVKQETHGVETTSEKVDKGIYYGKILEIKDAMGYKYLKVEEEGKTLWVAIASAPVKVGEKIGYDKQTIMKDFKSKSLGRTFKEIIFASSVYLPEKQKKRRIATLQDMVTGGRDPHQGMGVGKSPQKEDKKPSKPFVKKEFYTVDEIHMWRKSLKDQTIKVKGSVFKVSHQIMKLDWVHLGDGTGKELELTDDLVFTTKKSDLKNGDNVIATGKVIVDKDFGYGYFYKVIIQESTFNKEK